MFTFITEVEGQVVQVLGKSKTFPFTKIDEEYLKSYVERNLPKEKAKFIAEHHCAKCPTEAEQRSRHYNERWNVALREGKVFSV